MSARAGGWNHDKTTPVGRPLAGLPLGGGAAADRTSLVAENVRAQLRANLPTPLHRP